MNSLCFGNETGKGILGIVDDVEVKIELVKFVINTFRPDFEYKYQDFCKAYYLLYVDSNNDYISEEKLDDVYHKFLDDDTATKFYEIIYTRLNEDDKLTDRGINLYETLEQTPYEGFTTFICHKMLDLLYRTVVGHTNFYVALLYLEKLYNTNAELTNDFLYEHFDEVSEEYNTYIKYDM